MYTIATNYFIHWVAFGLTEMESGPQMLYFNLAKSKKRIVNNTKGEQNRNTHNTWAN